MMKSFSIRLLCAVTLFGTSVAYGGAAPVTVNAGPDQTHTNVPASGKVVTMAGIVKTKGNIRISKYSWKNGTTVLAEGASSAILQATFNLAIGNHTVSLVVLDNRGQTHTDSLNVSLQAAVVTPTPTPTPTPAPLNCTFSGQTVAHGQSVMAYQASSVPFGQSCASEQRTCNNGVLTGTYGFSSCSVQPAASCTFNGQTVAHGLSVTAYQTASVAAGMTCVSQQRLCNNGSLTGSYAFGSCTVDPGHVHPPTGGYELATDVIAITDAVIGFDPALAMQDVPVLPPASTGAEGFRFTCGLDGFAYDDPIVYPGQPGKAHLHQFFGNTNVSAYSTHDSLGRSGGSTCNQVTTGTNGNLVLHPYALNRSAYWIPALLDGGGNAVSPNSITVYYKRGKLGTPNDCHPSNSAQKCTGIHVGLPDGLKMIWGSDLKGGRSINERTDGGRQFYYNCQGTGAVPNHYATLEDAKKNCVVGGEIGVITSAPDCWDGVHVDVPDHRSHVAYGSYGSWGYYRCPLTHPYEMPTLTLGYWYTVTAQMLKPSYTGAHLSSDLMDSTRPPGWSGHGDYMEAWHKPTKLMWEGITGCVGGGKNCSGGNMGNGKQLRGAAQPIYNGTLMWKNPSPLVPLSTIPKQ